MKTILARLSLFVFILGGIPTITLSGCGVRGPLYLPQVPPAPQKPTQEEPKGVLWNSTPSKPTAPDKNTTPPATK
jgi:predicted small lipoprotein YifL